MLQSILNIVINANQGFKNGKDEIPHYIRNDRWPIRKKGRKEGRKEGRNIKRPCLRGLVARFMPSHLKMNICHPECSERSLTRGKEDYSI